MLDTLIRIERGGSGTLGSQVRRRLLEAIQAGQLRPGVQLPSTRVLAAQLGISRPIVVEAYGQLAAEGYLLLRRGTRPVVASSLAESSPAEQKAAAQANDGRFDLRPAMPDVSLFPRQGWARSVRTVLRNLPASALGYGNIQGSPTLRRVIADYLGRVRGAIADPDCIYITSGFAEGRALASATLYASGVRKLAVEDPSYSDWIAVDKAGLIRIPIPVDAHGVDVEVLAASDAEAAFVTPSHQFPLGGILSSKRRQRLVGWLRDGGHFALEDDYDAEFRYDAVPIGALQGLAPSRIIYAGTASKAMAPALRLGWLIVPPVLVDVMNGELRRWSEGPPRIDQDALAHFMETGQYDKHLRKMRRLYRQRRDHLIACLAREIPQLEVEGAAAGLHLTLTLPKGIEDRAIVTALRRHGVAVEGSSHYAQKAVTPCRLFIGYSRASERTIESAVRLLAAAIKQVGRGH
jgi:GntR family transcriptional regulator / MocR family aminotransferase